MYFVSKECGFSNEGLWGFLLSLSPALLCVNLALIVSGGRVWLLFLNWEVIWV